MELTTGCVDWMAKKSDCAFTLAQGQLKIVKRAALSSKNTLTFQKQEIEYWRKKVLSHALQHTINGSVEHALLPY